MLFEVAFPLLFDQLFGDLMLAIFGSPLLIGIFIMLFLYIFGLIMKLSFEMLTLSLFFGIMTLVVVFIPTITIFVIMIVGVFLGIFFFYKILGR